MSEPSKPLTAVAPGAELIARFAAITGDAHALTTPDQQAPFLREWRERYIGHTPLVLRPGSVGEVSQIMALANGTGTAVVPQGGNTGLVGGQIPFGPEIVLNLSRLKAIRAVDAAGYSLTAEAGATLADVQQAAEAAGRLFPLSLASQGSCQIGGNLSTNAGGVQVLAYGNARDLVLGLEVVLADGQIWNGLRSLRKDNTGYDLKHLFIGAEGTLGIITAAVLKLFPRPVEKTTLLAGLSSLEDVARLFERARNSGGSGLTAFEIMPRIGIEFVCRHTPGSRDPLTSSHAWYALLEFSSFTPTSDLASRCETLLESALEDGIVGDAVLAASLAQVDELWSFRERLSEVQRFEGGSIKHDVSVPIAHIPAFIAQANEAVMGLMPGARPVPFGHFGDGNIHYNITQPVGMDKAAFLARWLEVSDTVHALVLGFNGSISAEHGIGQMKRDELALIKSAVEMDLMRRIKASLDPNGILNPGKIL